MALDTKSRSRWVLLGALLLLPLVPMAEYLRVKEAVKERREQARRSYEGQPERISRETQQNLRQWPAKISVDSSGVRAYLGGSPQGDAKQEEMGMAAPFILCSLIKRYPQKSSSAKVRSVERFKVDWGVEVEGLSDLDVSLNYNRKDQTLSVVSFGPGGGRGTKFKGVTDKLLLQLDKDASQSQTTDINLRRLVQLGCKERNLWE